MRYILLIAILCMSSWADTLDGMLTLVTNETNASWPLTIIAGVYYASPNTSRIVFFCFDGQTSNCQSVTANTSVWTGSEAILAIPVGYKDGSYHNVYAWLQSLANAGQTSPQTGDLLLTGSPRPFKVISGVLQPEYAPANLAAVGKVKPNDICLVYNTNTATDSSFSATFGPWYATARGITNVVSVSLPSSGMTPTQFATLLASINAGCAAGTQWIALAWAVPSLVGSSEAICFAVTNNGYQTPTLSGSGITYKPFGNNPYFNTANTTPYTTYGIRPTIMVASGGASGTGDVSLAETMVTTAKAGDFAAPTGVADVLLSGDTVSDVRAQAFSTVDLSTYISPKLTVSTPAVGYLTSTTNIVGYFAAGGTYTTSFSGDTWVNGAFADTLISYAGALPSCQTQTCITWMIDHGAVGAYGSTFEPLNSPFRFVEPAIFLSRYTQGVSLIAAAWGSLQEMWYGANFFGDPLADPYGSSGPGGSALTGNAIITGKASIQ